MAKIAHRAVALDDLKKAAAEEAAKRIENGMVVGLGSGSTATLAVKAIGKRVGEGLRITGIPTSEKTAQLARELRIPLSELSKHDRIDVTIDGADEVESGTLNLIKGRGGALLREKIIASATARLIIVVDTTKLVERLPFHDAIPVEVVQFGWQTTAKRLWKLGANAVPRLGPDEQLYVTDEGHYILDCAFGAARPAAILEQGLNNVVGVVEHGLFLGMTSEVIVGAAEGVTILFPKQS